MNITDKEQFINIYDRAFQFGDGCFTTAAIINGKIQQFNEHIERLKRCCQRLMIKFINWVQLADEMKLLANQQSRAVIKIIISRGIGGFGYSSSNCNQAKYILALLEFPHHYSSLRTFGIKLILSPIKLSRNPFLAGIKHLNRLEQVMIRSYTEYHVDEEILVLDTEGMVIECSASNIFWRTGKQIFTPCLMYCGIDGIMRNFLITEIINSGYSCKIVSVGLEDIFLADEIILCNSLMPILPVRKLENKNYYSRQLFKILYNICKKYNFYL